MVALLLLLAALCSPTGSNAVSPDPAPATAFSELTSVSGETGCLTGMVAAHNAKRCLHEDTPALEWDDCLASCAQAWSDLGLGLQHSQTSGRCSQCNLGDAGENIAVQTHGTVDSVLKMWYDNEEVNWDYTTSRSTGGVTGHMTQVVWAATTKVGCGYNPTGWANQYSLWTCNYATAGNVWGTHSTHVKPRDNNKLAACDPCHGADCTGGDRDPWATQGFCSRPSGECECKEGWSGSSCTAAGGSGWEEDCSGGWPAPNTSPTTSEPTTSPPVTSEPTSAPTTYCRAGYDDIGLRWNWAIGKITIAESHEACSARCTQYSGPQYLGGCKGYMTGMYAGMLFCRSYGGERRDTPCAFFAHPSSPGYMSGALGSIHARTEFVNIGGNCCQNMTFVPTGR